MREETVAKKKPKITITIAPITSIGMIGVTAIATMRIASIMSTTDIFRSFSVRSSFACFPEPFNPFIASANVLTISGRDLIRLTIPPVATAPAPI